MLFRYGNGMIPAATAPPAPAGQPDAQPRTADTPSQASTDIYLLAAHPSWRESRVNCQMLDLARAAPRVEVRDLYASYPDFVIDVAAEQAALSRATLVVLLHPIQWYAMPPLVLHGAHSSGQPAIDQHTDTFAQRLASYPDWPELDDLESCPACVVPLHDRHDRRDRPAPSKAWPGYAAKAPHS